MNTKINKKEITFSDDAEAFFEKVTSACKAMTPLELDKVLEEMGLTVIEEEGKENKEEELKLIEAEMMYEGIIEWDERTGSTPRDMVGLTIKDWIHNFGEAVLMLSVEAGKVKKLEAELKEEKWHWANADELLDIYRAKVDKLEAMIMKNR
jgi:hypothetical protein